MLKIRKGMALPSALSDLLTKEENGVPAMDYGVTITSGPREWEILQRNADGFARIEISGEYRCMRQSQELPLTFTQEKDAGVVVKARIALEETGESVLPWTNCEITAPGLWRMLWEQVPQGGLYRVETYMEYEGWNGLSSTRGDMVHSIGVGDVFVIAGQSNASGRAKTPVQDAPELGVHVLRPSGKWALATHPLAETTGAIYLGNFENHNPGHTPWLHFAKRLKRELGIPIGLVPAAYGGSPLRWWNPSENGALFANMLELLGQCQVQPKAVLWYQGEAEGYENGSETYLQRFTQLVEATRDQLHSPELPWITVQLNRCVVQQEEALDRHWGRMREAQRQAMHTLKGVYTVPANDVSLYDFIHNSSEGNLIVGERCARCALAELYGKPVDWRAPEPVQVVQTTPDTLRVTFDCIRNWLNPYDVPAESLPLDAEDGAGLVHPIRYETGRDCLTLVFPRALTGEVRLHGAWRMNTGGLIPNDCMRMPMLSFYSVAAKEDA